MAEARNEGSWTTQRVHTPERPDVELDPTEAEAVKEVCYNCGSSEGEVKRCHYHSCRKPAHVGQTKPPAHAGSFCAECWEYFMAYDTLTDRNHRRFCPEPATAE